jgi:hypothetical protein
MVKRSALLNGVLVALLLIAAGINYATYPFLAVAGLWLTIAYFTRRLFRRQLNRRTD